MIKEIYLKFFTCMELINLLLNSDRNESVQKKSFEKKEE